MIKIIISFFVFCVVLFLYIHTQFHLKTSDDLEIFEIEQASKDTLDEICDFRQPVIFELEQEQYNIIKETNKKKILENYAMFEIKIRDNIINNDSYSEEELYIPLSLDIANKLFDQDKNSNYFSEKNQDFLEETGIIKTMQQNDLYLRPPLISNCYYDIMMGSKGLTTPFRYNINYRNFYMVTQGSIQIKLAPPKSIKYLYSENDYENFEFRSPINPWNPQNKYKSDFNKIKCLEITLTPGKCFYIPAYWYYSFKFDNDTSVSCFHYRTYMNNVAITPHILMHVLQTTNVKRKIAKKLNLDIHHLFNDKTMNDKDINNSETNDIENINININTDYIKESSNIIENIIQNNDTTTIIDI
jgi:hypothetical protein